MHPLEMYLEEIAQTRATGANVKELSYYPAIKNLLDAAGKELKPKVQSVFSLKNQGGGMPDGGLFTASQVRSAPDDKILEQVPERGAIEVKSPQENAADVAKSAQVSGYAQRYGLVLVTNLREFVLVKQAPSGKPQVIEQFTLASDETTFWHLARARRKTAALFGDAIIEYLKRALMYQAELSDPKDLAWFMASYARDAHTLVDAAGDLPALGSLRQAMQQGLNMEFAGEKGEHFFRSTLVQTLFYGVFSAWVLWHHEDPTRTDTFDWRFSRDILKVPIIQSLFYQLSDPRKLQALGLEKYLALTGEALNRVNRAAFFARFDQGKAVQYFYEPFLEAYDPQLRKALGVWYTPQEIVTYMVERVDRVLREELGLRDGLADKSVYVLDPCCGTGAYPLEVLKRIARTLEEKGERSLLGYELKQAATQRVFGFELLPAPFVIAHLQTGLFLQQHEAPLGDNERAGVYLTNSLTGWEPPKGPKQHLLLPELEEERDAAERVKRETPVLVILGNPPYNAFAGVAKSQEEKNLVKVYKTGLREIWGIKKYNLDELYVRFFRLAERRIAEKTRRGVVSFISNHSWTKEPSFVVLREHLLASFDKFWIENMHGDRKITEYAPDGHSSETIFAVRGFSPGIQQGIAISLWVKSGKREEPRVFFRDDLTEAKAEKRREHLINILHEADFDAAYESVRPTPENRYSFRPSEIKENYKLWPKVIDLCAEYSNGLMEKRGGSLMDLQRDNLEKRIKAYFDSNLVWDDYKALDYGLTEEQAGFEPKTARLKALKSEKFNPERILRYLLRPFDIRWCYYTTASSVWNRSRPALWAQLWDQNEFFITRFKSSKDTEGIPFYWTALLSDDHCLAPDAVAIPIRLQKNGAQFDLFSLGLPIRANLSDPARAYLAKLSFDDPDSSEEIKQGLKAYELIWYHALAIGYSPAYRSENEDGIRGDWPRIPLPASREALIASAVLGRQIAALLDSEGPTPEILNRPEINRIAVLCRTDGKQIQPQQGDLAITAGWGHAQGNIVMPGLGKTVEREGTRDIYLNDKVFWQNVTRVVWEYTIGGYQVIKKWLSYRERSVLGRDLTVDEAREVTNMARRIAGLIALEDALDENYRVVKAETVPLG